jgi:hypothetical protein
MLHLLRYGKIDVEPREELGGSLKHEGPVDPASSSRLLANENIFGHGQIGEERWMLVHNGNAVTATFDWRPQYNRITVLQNRPSARLMDTPDDLDQSALASAVLASERVYATSKKRQPDVGQNLDVAEAFADVPQFEDRKHYLGFVRRSGLPVHRRAGGQLSVREKSQKLKSL